MDSITIKDRKFNFEIPSAWDGCAIFNMITSYGIPFGATEVFGLNAKKRAIPPDELETLLKLCLKHCTEEIQNLPEGTKPPRVVDADGNVGIINAGAPMLTQIATQYLVFFMDWWQAENS